MIGNVPVIVNTGIKNTEFPIKHLAKTLYFIFLSINPNQKDLANLVKSAKNWVKHQNPY